MSSFLYLGHLGKQFILQYIQTNTQFCLKVIKTLGYKVLFFLISLVVRYRIMGTVRRVVVTGLGLITPLGVGTPYNWMQLTAGRVATSALTDPRYAQVCPNSVRRVSLHSMLL